MRQHLVFLSILTLLVSATACSSTESNKEGVNNPEKAVEQPAEPEKKEEENKKEDPSVTEEDSKQEVKEEEKKEEPKTESEPKKETESKQPAKGDQKKFSSATSKTKKDKILLEGNPEEFTFTLHDVNTLGFKTYVIEDMVAETVSSGEGDVFVVKSNFGGNINEDARISIFSPNNLNVKSIGELTELSKELNQINGFTIREPGAGHKNLFSLSKVEYRIEKKKPDGIRLLGTVSIFAKGNRYYMLTMYYPEDYSEGFVPRAIKMVEDITWN